MGKGNKYFAAEEEGFFIKWSWDNCNHNAVIILRTNRDQYYTNNPNDIDVEKVSISIPKSLIPTIFKEAIKAVVDNNTTCTFTYSYTKTLDDESSNSVLDSIKYSYKKYNMKNILNKDLKIKSKYLIVIPTIKIYKVSDVSFCISITYTYDLSDNKENIHSKRVHYSYLIKQ